MALREINLVPPDILERRFLKRHLSFWSGCLLMLLLLVSGWFIYEKYFYLAQKRVFTNLQETHTHLGIRIQEIKRIQEELEKLDHQQSVLNTITKGPVCSKVLWELADIMNEYTWVTEVNVENDEDLEDFARMRLIGNSFSNNELGNFMSILSTGPMFEGVLLKYAQERRLNTSKTDENEDLKVVRFEIECKLPVI